MLRMRFGTVFPLAVVALVGIGVGLSAVTFVYARGYSYLFDDPQACINCHVMREYYQTWQVSAHRQVSCNGCHTPHDLAGKYLVKGENGFVHAWVFTFSNPQNIQIRERSRAVVESNCVDCHREMIGNTFLDPGHESKNPFRFFMVEKAEERCTVCHASVGHVLR
ncbi:MAG: cytochrome c nitrite reductase small subunit [Chloroflexi bacterium]|nr:cytochrome c nitrite reductase small subunit [Chloroflexota bacterium]